MESAALDTVRKYYSLVDANEVDALVLLFAHDAVYERPGYPGLHGREEIRSFYTAERIIASGTHTLGPITLAADRSAAVEGAFSGILKDGQEVTVRFADFFTVDDGRISSRRTYFFSPLV